MEGCEGPRGLDCVHKGATGELVRGGGGGGEVFQSTHPV